MQSRFLLCALAFPVALSFAPQATACSEDITTAMAICANASSGEQLLRTQVVSIASNVAVVETIDVLGRSSDVTVPDQIDVPLESIRPAGGASVGDFVIVVPGERAGEVHLAIEEENGAVVLEGEAIPTETLVDALDGDEGCTQTLVDAGLSEQYQGPHFCCTSTNAPGTWAFALIVLFTFGLVRRRRRHSSLDGRTPSASAISRNFTLSR